MKVQRVPLNYPPLAEKTRENVEDIKNPVHGGHLADDARHTQHIQLTSAEWAESAQNRVLNTETLGALRVVGAVESHIAGLGARLAPQSGRKVRKVPGAFLRNLGKRELPALRLGAGIRAVGRHASAEDGILRHADRGGLFGHRDAFRQLVGHLAQTHTLVGLTLTSLACTFIHKLSNPVTMSMYNVTRKGVARG